MAAARLTNDLSPVACSAIRRLLGAISLGAPMAVRRDGVVFGNREGRLPVNPFGYYKETTVRLPGHSGRGALRLVTGEGGEVYYSRDH